MRILITGHKGYIGSYLANRLQKKYNVTGYDILDGQDLCSMDFPDKFDLIIHLAGKSGVRDSVGDPKSFWQNNVVASRRLFDRYSDTRILYASSSSAYEPDLNPYAASKYCVEEAAARHPNTLGMRFHTVYSHQPRKGMFLQKYFDNELEYVTNHYRDFIHIEDLCDGIDLCMNTNYTGIIDIGTGNPIKISDLLDLPIKMHTPDERQWTCANMEKIKRLGFKPKHNLKYMLANRQKDNIVVLYDKTE